MSWININRTRGFQFLFILTPLINSLTRSINTSPARFPLPSKKEERNFPVFGVSIMTASIVDKKQALKAAIALKKWLGEEQVRDEAPWGSGGAPRRHPRFISIVISRPHGTILASLIYLRRVSYHNSSIHIPKRTCIDTSTYISPPGT